ncbi:ATP-binding protein [Nocardia brevicatena]|uniref:ATP-binding protein n=1 Tax=Nocardia brevicatena TaxID=37327 RepID=UPI00030EB9AF|nr:ATP-binding protein [Nocardia brevicatena]
MAIDRPALIDSLCSLGGDCTNIEVKSATGGLPDSLTSTLSALANLPGGGLIILGLDERDGFRPTGWPDPQKLKQGLAQRARSFTPPVQLTIDDATIDGKPVVAAVVHECAPSAKPCRVDATGAAYLRGYDGDFRMSTLEEQAFLAARQAPHFDRTPVTEASRSDLDDELVDDFARTVRLRDRHGLGRFSGEELLRRAGVITTGGVPTLAGLLALGTYPQQWFPQFVVRAAAEPGPTDPPGTRARNQVTLTGPIPRMLDAALEWAGQTFDTAIVSRPDGTVVDVPSYPLVAFRELIANALLHRDLDQWSQGMAVEVRLRRDRLIVTNPGGLYGVTVDRLGKDAVTSARNMWLVNICQYLRSPESGSRVIEALATGIPTIAHALKAGGLPPAQYSDMGIRFTAVLRTTADPRKFSGEAKQRQTVAQSTVERRFEAINPGTTALSPTQVRIAEILATGPHDTSQLQPLLELSTSTIRKALRGMRDAGIVVQTGGRGRRTFYELTDPDESREDRRDPV